MHGLPACHEPRWSCIYYYCYFYLFVCVGERVFAYHSTCIEVRKQVYFFNCPFSPTMHMSTHTLKENMRNSRSMSLICLQLPACWDDPEPPSDVTTAYVDAKGTVKQYFCPSSAPVLRLQRSTHLTTLLIHPHVGHHSVSLHSHQNTSSQKNPSPTQNFLFPINFTNPFYLQPCNICIKL